MLFQNKRLTALTGNRKKKPKNLWDNKEVIRKRFLSEQRTHMSSSENVVYTF